MVCELQGTELQLSYVRSSPLLVHSKPRTALYRHPASLCCMQTDEILARSLNDGPSLLLDDDARSRVAAYLELLLNYNERTNIYSKNAYRHLPFHVHDSISLGLVVSELKKEDSAVLDLGSGSGLPSLLIACVNPEIPVHALESKSRKTRFLQRAGRELQLPLYTSTTCNIVEFARSSYVDADFVTAKAFKPLSEVSPIAAACIGREAVLHIPISEAQVAEYVLSEDQLLRRGSFLYYRQSIKPSRGLSQRAPLLSRAASKS